MNQDSIKKNLLELHECAEDFTVIFSGKKIKTINGLYKPEKNEIIIHNLNFENNETGDNLLFYTAMHELAHHIQFTEHKQKSARSHTQLFYSILDDLADIAEEKKLYTIGVDEETRKLIDEARDISCKIAELQRKLGAVLLRLNEVCREKGIRFDDVIERKVQISLKTVKQTTRAHSLNIPENLGADIQEAALKERDDDRRDSMIHAAQKGKSVVQVKRTPAGPIEHEDETVSLIKEKRRIERTIAFLNRCLEEVIEQLQSRGESE